MQSIRVFLVHRKELIREGLSRILAEQSGIELVGVSSGGREGLKLMHQLEPDIVIADTDVADFDLTVEAGQYISEKLPDTRVVLLTDSNEERSLLLALKLGARAYLSDDISVTKLTNAIRGIYEGEVIISPPFARRLLQEFTLKEDIKRESHAKDHTDLTRREIEVLNLVAEGMTNRELADALFITENTAKVHMRSIMDKLHVRNRQQAVHLATQKGIVSPRLSSDIDDRTGIDKQ